MHRMLDDTYAPDVRAHVGLLAVGRLTGNAAYRFAVPFLATIAAGLGVSLARLGVGLAITELVSLSAPLIGALIERVARRTAMAAGLFGVAVGAVIAGTARGLVQFVVGLAVLSVTKVSYDVALGAWIADRVPWQRRSRVISLTETSWALGMLAGVSVLALVVAISSWHVAYLVVAAVVLVAGGAVLRRLPHDGPTTRHTHGRTITLAGQGPTRRIAVPTTIAVAALAGSSQFLFMTYGSWLEDRFGVSATGLAAVTFGLGALELVSSMFSVGHTDAWGKERCVVLGTCVMAPAAVVVAVGAGNMWVMLPAFGVFLMGFELAIISGLPLGAELTPNRPAVGLARLIAAVTLARSVVAIPATAWLDEHGLAWPGAGAATLAVVAGISITARHRMVST